VRAGVELFDEGRLVDLSSIGMVLQVGSILEPHAGEMLQLRTRWFNHLAFNYGDTRLRRNPDSLIEHLEFRRAIAHAVDRDRIAAEVPAVPTSPMSAISQSYSPSLIEDVWSRYDHDPNRARGLLGDLCERLGRDCISKPPVLAYTQSVANLESQAIAELLVEMLGDVGIDVVVNTENPWEAPGCPGWESLTFQWSGSAHVAGLSEFFSILDPQASPFFYGDGEVNVYQWGTGPFDSSGMFEDDPSTEDCDEATVFDEGPSSVQDEYTVRYGELLRQREGLIETAALVAVISELEEIIADQVVFIPLYLYSTPWPVRSDIVGGIEDIAVDNPELPAFWNVDRWYLKQPQPGA
jgi:ABC-type transport system substrate-binding protein